MRRSVAPLEAAPREGLREGFGMLCLGFSRPRPYLPCAAIGLHCGTPHIFRNERPVVPHGDDDWAVKAPHAEPPSGVFPHSAGSHRSRSRLLLTRVRKSTVCMVRYPQARAREPFCSRERDHRRYGWLGLCSGSVLTGPLGTRSASSSVSALLVSVVARRVPV